MWQALVGKLLGSLPEEVAQYYREKQKLKQELKLEKLRGKAEIERAKAEAKAKRADQEAAWEIQQIHNSGWKDEYWTVVLSSPLILVFVPKLQPYIADGFVALEGAPEWYLVSVGTAIAAAFGVRPVINYFTRKRQ